MRKVIVAVAVLFAVRLSAQVHEATSQEELMRRYGLQPRQMDAKEMAGMDMASHDMSTMAATALPLPTVNVLPPESTATARTFNITAREFTYDISPSPFVVNQGDTVVLNITTADVHHGFFLENYAASDHDILPGKPITIQFVANTAGNFTYFCTFVCGTGHDNMNGRFTVNAQQQVLPPTISSISPTSGSGGTHVLISGANFVTGATVTFGGVPSANVTVSTSQIDAVAPSHSVGAVSLVVTNPDNQTASTTFTYAVPTPTITSIAPSTGPTSGNTEITISGTNFVQGATVTIGGVPAHGATWLSANTLTAITPLGPVNVQGSLAEDVKVTNPDGLSVVSIGGFTYNVPAPAIASLAPAVGLPNGGTVVTITGVGFTTASSVAVLFGGVPATKVAIINAVTLSVTAPAHAIGAVDVTLMVGAASATAHNAFTFADPPPRRRTVGH